jgi:hypothetical protein
MRKRGKLTAWGMVLIVNLMFSFTLHEGRCGEGGRKWAVIVGIDKYMKEVTPLRCATNDAREFSKALVESQGFEEDDVFLLTSDQSGNRLPDKSSMVRWISHVKQHAGPRDTFVFYFSGHGMDMDHESYLLTYEADPFSRETLEVSSLKITDLTRFIDDIKAGTKLVFVDACRSDPRTGKGDSDNRLSEAFSKSLVIKGQKEAAAGEEIAATFFSCKVSQRSYEWTEKSMGFFTYFLCKGLRGEAADNRGAITLNSLEEYLGRTVPAAVQKERGYLQTPWMRRSGAGGGGDRPLANRAVAARKTDSGNPAGLSQGLPSQPSAVQEAPQVIARVQSPEARKLRDAAASLDLKEIRSCAAGLDRATVAAALSCPDDQGFTPLHNAASSDRKDIVEYLLSLGISIDLKDNSGWTPLQWTIQPDLKDMAGFLISKGAQVNDRDISGSTPLHWAVFYARKDMVELLLDRGADVNARDRNGNTPLTYATGAGLSEIVGVLKGHGARQ